MALERDISPLVNMFHIVPLCALRDIFLKLATLIATLRKKKREVYSHEK